MSDYKRNYPRRGAKALKGFFFDATALDLSLEATGLAAHIMAFGNDEIDEEYIAQLFPGRDLAPLLQEIAAIGLIELNASPEPLPICTEAEHVSRFKKAGTIYLVEGASRFKIGISSQSVRARLANLQTGSPIALRLVHSAFVADCGEAERLAHGLLAKYRLHGEWFSCSESQAMAVLATVIEAVGEARAK